MPNTMNHDTPTRQCPDCESPLTKKNLDPVRIDECPNCSGIFFESDEFRQTKDAADSDLEWMDFDVFQVDECHTKSSTRKCPGCQLSMVMVNYATTGVEIEACARCKAIWLDKGEFQKILAALESEANAKDTLGHLKSTFQEGMELLNGPESLVSEWKDFTKACQFLGRRCVVENPNLSSAISALQKFV
jgi:Zn-finger nucleic acid-binding protein